MNQWLNRLVLSRVNSGHGSRTLDSAPVGNLIYNQIIMSCLLFLDNKLLILKNSNNYYGLFYLLLDAAPIIYLLSSFIIPLKLFCVETEVGPKKSP